MIKGKAALRVREDCTLFHRFPKVLLSFPLPTIHIHPFKLALILKNKEKERDGRQ